MSDEIKHSTYLSPGVPVDVLAGVVALVGPVAKVEALLAPHAVRRGRAAKVSTVI